MYYTSLIGGKMLHKTISRLILQLHRALLSIKYLMRKYKESFFQTTKGILITRYIRNYVRFIKFIRQMQTISALYKPRFKSPGKDFFILHVCFTVLLQYLWTLPILVLEHRPSGFFLMVLSVEGQNQMLVCVIQDSGE